MKETLRQSWSIFCQAAKVFKSDRKLLVDAGTLIVLMLIGLLIIFRMARGVTLNITNMDIELLQQMPFGEKAQILAVPLGFCFIGTAGFYFCFTVYICELLQTMRQPPGNWRLGFAFGLSRIKIILLWSLLITAVWSVLELTQLLCGTLGSIAGSTLQFAWYAISCFDIACIVVSPEINTPWGILRRSAATLRKAWGKVLSGALPCLAILIGGEIMIQIGIEINKGTAKLLKLGSPIFMILIVAAWQAYLAILYQKINDRETAPANEPQPTPLPEVNHGQKEM